MEILVKKDKSSINDLYTELTSIGFVFDSEMNNPKRSDSINQDAYEYVVIDNKLCIFWYEDTIRKDRKESHYIDIKSVDNLENLIKIIKNEVIARSNSNKPQWSLVDFDSFEVMVRVLELGKEKYERNNWKKGAGTYTEETALEIWESGFRHFNEIKKGIESGDIKDIYDKDLGTNHIGNAMCNLMFLSFHLIQNGNQSIFKPNK